MNKRKIIRLITFFITTIGLTWNVGGIFSTHAYAKSKKEELPELHKKNENYLTIAGVISVIAGGALLVYETKKSHHQTN
ncbi:LPXTG cell wall anchor domain-containing protein [Lactobacillus crispatus]|jgi:uncharacterized membrane protein HdeD (DUF308 family)|uniref:LPXTG cell wall anchor domain-containing protein n=1 Tax=Lactobacillus crispatus TaxID=47770 RepID=UPI0018AA1C7F|nr:LPXTG cell wall anchor domain-containing protein [Lactobacillus crispatus]